MITWTDGEPPEPLTGLRRYRENDHGELVLQVEYSKYLHAYTHWACFWRDATPDDVTEAVVLL